MGEKKIEVIRRRVVSETEILPSAVDADVVKAEIKQVLYGVLKRMLAKPEQVQVSVVEGDRTTIYEVDIANEDFGRLIGSKGKNIASLRTIVAGMSAVNGFRSIIRVKDEDRFF